MWASTEVGALRGSRTNPPQTCRDNYISKQLIFKQMLGKVKVLEKHICPTSFHHSNQLLLTVDICSIRCFGLQKFYYFNSHSEERKKNPQIFHSNFHYFNHFNKFKTPMSIFLNHQNLASKIRINESHYLHITFQVLLDPKEFFTV